MGSDDFLGPAPALEVTAQYLNTRQQPRQLSPPLQKGQPRFSFSQSLPYNINIANIPAAANTTNGAQPDFTSCSEIMSVNYYNAMTGNLGDGTIRPGMLEADFDFDRMETGDMMYDYIGENNLMMAT